MMARTLLITSVLLSLAGCNPVGPDYVGAPEVAHSRGFSGARGQESARPLDRWWRLLGDPKLNRLVNTALDNNHDLRIAEQRLREARALRRQAAGAFLPRVGTNLAFTRLDFGGLLDGDLLASPNATSGFLENPFDFWSSGFDVSWEMDVFGGRRREERGARARAEAAREALLGVRLAVAAEVVETYFTIAGLREQFARANAQVRLQQSQVDDTRDRVAAGAASKLDLDRARARLEATRAQVPTLEAGVASQSHRLALLLGERSDALDGRKVADNRLPTNLPMTRAGLPAELVLRRPDLRQSERDLAAATEDIGVAAANFYPKFTIGGGPGRIARSLDNLFDASSLYWLYAPRVEWSPFTAGANRAILEGANARQKAALLNYEKSVLAAIGEVEIELANLKAETRRLSAVQRALSAAGDAHRRVSENHQAGAIDSIEVLIEEERLREIEITEIRVKSQLIQVWVRLHKALGGGW